MKKLTIQDLGLTPQEIKTFVKGARTAYGNMLQDTPLTPPSTPVTAPFTNPKSRK